MIDSGLEHTNHVAALIRAYAGPRGLSRVERTAGFKDGYLRNYTKPSATPARIPTLEVLKRLAGALGATLEEVSKAFAADMRLPLYDDHAFTEDEYRLVVCFRSLPPAAQQSLAVQVEALAAHHASDEPDPECADLDSRRAAKRVTTRDLE